jgi:hypothetical protein
MKVADVKLSWSKSPSSDVKGVKIVVTKDGVDTVTEGGPEVESLMIVVEASKSVQFKVITLDSEGLTATSDVYSFSLGDLEAPQPATSLMHEVVGIRDVPDPVPAPPAA